jgi:hypothetical protein
VFALAQPYTLACWCVVPNVAPTGAILTNPEYMIFQIDSGDLLLHNGSWVVSAAVLANNVPFHAAAVANGGNGYIYKDGVLVASGYTNVGSMTANFLIGARTYAGTYYFTGRMCEVAMWAASLSRRSGACKGRLAPRSSN